MKNNNENEYICDNGVKYISWDMAAKELGISREDLHILLNKYGYCYSVDDAYFNCKPYMTMEFFEKHLGKQSAVSSDDDKVYNAVSIDEDRIYKIVVEKLAMDKYGDYVIQRIGNLKRQIKQ